MDPTLKQAINFHRFVAKTRINLFVSFLIQNFSLSKKLLFYTGASGGPEAIFWPHFGILNNFPHFL